MLAYDHRGEEGINLIRQYVEDYAAEHDGRYPLPAEVDGDGAVGSGHYWPSNPWDHYDMAQRRDRGSFAYEVSADRTSYVLRLHRALKNDYVLRGTIMTSPWRHLLASLEDEILRRSGRILAGYVDQWSLQHAGALPTVAEMAPAAAVGAAHPDWPQDPDQRRRHAARRRTRARTATRPAPPAPTPSPSISTPATSRPAAPRRRLRRRRAAPAPRSPDHQEAPVTRRVIVVALATAVLALASAAAAPRAEAVSFVDKQVQAGALLIQNYINTYGRRTGSSTRPSPWSRRAAGCPTRRCIWPSNPWTGKIMAPGTSRGTYTYTLGAGRLSYRLTVHLSSGNYVLKSAMPSWFKRERNTAARQNLLLLQRYVEAYAAAHGGSYPTADLVTSAGFGASYVWPVDPWTGAPMAAGDTPGCYSYAGGGAGYTLKVMLTSGWSASFGPLPVLGQLTTPAGG